MAREPWFPEQVYWAAAFAYGVAAVVLTAYAEYVWAGLFAVASGGLFWAMASGRYR